MIPNIQNTVAAAVRSRRRLKIHYDGRVAARVLEPHILYTSEDKVLTLLAFQVKGFHSSTRRGPFWRPFQLRKIDRFSVTDELFEPRIEAGFFKVAAMVKGQVLLRVQEAGEYTCLNKGFCGPPFTRRLN